MRRIFFLAIFFCSTLMILESCSSARTAVKTNNFKKADVTGSWNLNNITFEGIPAESIRSLFGEPSYKCFAGSTWNFPNSGNGTYVLTGTGECASKTQNIVWSVKPENGTFQFKKLNEGDKAKNIDEGYVLSLTSVSTSGLTLKSPVTFGSTTAYVVLNFLKAGR